MQRLKKMLQSFVELLVREYKWRVLNEQLKQKSPHLAVRALPKR